MLFFFHSRVAAALYVVVNIVAVISMKQCPVVSLAGLVESSTDDQGAAWLLDETMQTATQPLGLEEGAGGRGCDLISLWTDGGDKCHDLAQPTPYSAPLPYMPRPLIGGGRGGVDGGRRGGAGLSFPGPLMDLRPEPGGELRSVGTKKRRPSVCCFCQKAFSSPANLETHLRTHTGERPFGCSTCGKTFSQYWNLKIHKHIHTGERPYQCPHCPDTFSDPSNLKKHQKRHHPQLLKRPQMHLQQNHD